MGVPQPAPDSAGASDRWAPLVIGRPVPTFAPRPPQAAPYRSVTAGSYRPDTLCDVWSNGFFTIRLASVRGYAHRYEGTSRQDDAAVVEHEPTGTVVFAIADGVSAAAQSHLGSTLACQVSIAAVLDALDADPERLDWPGIVRTTARHLVAYAQHLLALPAPELDPAQELLATTLLVGTVRPAPDASHEAIATIARIGDTNAWLLRTGSFQDVSGPERDSESYVLSSGVAALPQACDALRVCRVALPPGAVLLAGTDGFGGPLGTGSGLVGRRFAEILAAPPTGLELAHALDFSRDTFDDDRTLIVIWPIPEPANLRERP